MKILITAAGGGHFAPMLAVIQKLPKEWEFLIIGRKYAFEGDRNLSLEYQTAKRENLPFVTLTTGRFQRKFTRYTIPSLLKIPFGFFQATAILKRYKPDVVVSFGGYIAVPVTLAAFLLNIPVVVHEQTLAAGASNKFASRFAKKICISWKESEKYFPKEKVILTGNPIREFRVQNLEFRIPQEEIPLIYITGGSTGAHAINSLIKQSLPDLLKKYRVIHQTGDAKSYHDFDDLQDLKKSLPEKLQKRYLAVKFVQQQDVGSLLQQADLVVTRAGITTITELLYFGKPALLIPLLFSQHDEQQKNAQFFADLGMGEIARQDSVTFEQFLSVVDDMIAKKETYEKHAKEVRTLVQPRAAEKIIDVIAHV